MNNKVFPLCLYNQDWQENGLLLTLSAVALVASTWAGGFWVFTPAGSF
ncbi:hypothetical protein [Edaphovirga cremea]|nr:hypothetical protein [Edaphovirga cremea]